MNLRESGAAQPPPDLPPAEKLFPLLEPPRVAAVVPTPQDPAFAEVGQLAAWLREGKTTPTDLAEYFLDRLERLGPHYNALVTLTRQRAMAEARRAQEELAAGVDRGPLHGIPYGAKDLLATRDYPTSWGAAPLRAQQFDEDATVIRKLGQAGAVLIGKLAMVELAGGMGYQQADASFTGPGLNPWDRRAWSGGSSSGSGAAVAAGLVSFAIGSETWGSIVTPAAFCGVTGVRPTYGRVSRHGAMALSWTLDKLGPLTLSARDAAWVLSAIAGPDPADPTTLPQRFPVMAPALGRPARLAVIEGADDALQPGVSRNYRASLDILAQMGELTTVRVPDFPFSAATDLILSAETASAFEDLIGTERALSLQAPEDRVGGIAAGYIFAKDYIRALRLRGKAIRILDEWLAPFDGLVSPPRASVAYPAHDFEAYRRYRTPGIGGGANLAGLPCVCVPNGFGEGGLPTGIELAGRALAEPILLRLAHDFQERTGWHQMHPQVG